MAQETDPAESRREQRMIERARQRLERSLSRPSIQRAIADAISASKSGDSLEIDKLTQKILSRIGKPYARALDLDATPIIRILSPPPQPQPPLSTGGSIIELPTETTTVAGPTCIGLNLYTKTGEPSNQVWVGAGLIGFFSPEQWGGDPQAGKFIANSGSGNVWAEVNINQENGAIVSVAVTSGGTIPSNTSTAFYYTLGYYSYNDGVPSVTNYGCGSLVVTVCRNWFSVDLPYSVYFNRGAA